MAEAKHNDEKGVNPTGTGPGQPQPGSSRAGENTVTQETPENGVNDGAASVGQTAGAEEDTYD